ncbi:hypothetical protein Tcan_12601, partial [Toxocara canis]
VVYFVHLAVGRRFGKNRELFYFSSFRLYFYVMCIYKKNRRQPQSETVETAVSGTESEMKFINEGRRARKESASKVAVMHKKREGRKKEMSENEMRVQLEAAQMAMGVMPNTTLVDRIHCHKDKLSQEISTASKRGDIQFSLIAPKRRSKEETRRKLSKEKITEDKNALKDDDTLHPLLAKPTALVNGEQDEEFVEDEVEEPNSENYMYNEKEIYYTCHDMIRELNAEDLPDATGDVLIESECITLDVGAPIEELEKRETFSCQTLRRNTFLSNSLSMPNKDEQQTYKPQKHTRIVRFSEGIIDITDWGENSCALVTPPEPSVRTQSELQPTALEEMKTQELISTTLATQDSKEYRQSVTSAERSKDMSRQLSSSKDAAATQRTSA